MRKAKYKNIFLIVFSILLFLGRANFVSAQNYYYDSIIVDITINKDSTIDVSEKQWAGRFKDFAFQEPNWYVGAYHGGAVSGVGFNSFGDFSNSFPVFPMQ